MSDIIYTSEIYDVDPTTIMFDKEMVEFNRLHTTEEYVSTINSIKNINSSKNYFYHRSFYKKCYNHIKYIDIYFIIWHKSIPLLYNSKPTI